MDEKQALVPRLRFPEFRDAGEWDNFTLSKISERITDKVGSQKLPTVSITAGYGFVSQAAKFGRDISGQQYKNYIHLKKGQFSYNKGNSKRFPQGCIYQLTEFEQVAAPSAFISFKFNDAFVPEFFKGYFDSNFHGYQLLKFITSGARSDGLLNINPNDFFSIRLPTPKKKEEQQKIADCLSSLDALIAAQADKIDALKAHKKGLMQQLFPREGETIPRLRFPEFQDAGEWEEKSLSDCCHLQAGKFVRASDIHQELSSERYPCYGGNGLRGYTETFTHKGQYPLIGRQGAQCGNVNLANGRFHATEHAVVVTANQGVDIVWLFYKLIRMDLNQHATGQAQPGLSVESLNKLTVRIPENEKEQQKIADILRSLDKLIAANTKKLEALMAHKKGLMQQLFPSPEAEAAGA